MTANIKTPIQKLRARISLSKRPDTRYVWNNIINQLV
jgi:hypothetical protein